MLLLAPVQVPRPLPTVKELRQLARSPLLYRKLIRTHGVAEVLLRYGDDLPHGCANQYRRHSSGGGAVPALVVLQALSMHASLRSLAMDLFSTAWDISQLGRMVVVQLPPLLNADECSLFILEQGTLTEAHTGTLKRQ